MTLSTLHSLVLSAVRDVSPDRLQRAVCSLADGSLTITLTRQADTEIRALVRNGDNVEYGVTLAQGMTSCSCKDALYRGVVCKHATAVALHVLRTPQPKEQSTKNPIHLMWRDGRVLCGVHNPEWYWVYPWTSNVWNWSDICADCKAAWKQPATLAAAA
jgi:uncharacterized Zn finger protein